MDLITKIHFLAMDNNHYIHHHNPYSIENNTRLKESCHIILKINKYLRLPLIDLNSNFSHIIGDFDKNHQFDNIHKLDQ
jgi:hypothetical protein